ncbi:MAG: hypothetical protein SFW64_01220 [Alphaproteobacteria bacterium]|nr:hypothetical protein [Alphaproteobacteria bacterium]
MPVFSPAILAAAAAAAPATPVGGAAAGTPPTSPGATPTAKNYAGYKILYAAFNGCGTGDNAQHNFDNLGALENEGIKVTYANVNPLPKEMPIIPTAPGTQANNTFKEGITLLDRYDIAAFFNIALLIAPSGEAIGSFDSKQNTFVTNVTTAIQAHQQAQSAHTAPRRR